MSIDHCRFLAIVIFAALTGMGCASQSGPWDKAGWHVTFHDEFNGSALDQARWAPRYDDDPTMPANYVLDKGVLHLRLDKDEPPQLKEGKGRVCGIATRGTAMPFAQQYGLFELRARMPKGSGLCAMFDMVPANTAYNKMRSAGGARDGANESTRIDVIEYLAKDVHANNFTAHYGRDENDEGRESSHVAFPADLSADFHTYALRWEPEMLTWLVDGQEVHRSIKAPKSPFYIRLALFEGGSVWRGPVEQSGFPKDFEIDYVRVYKK